MERIFVTLIFLLCLEITYAEEAKPLAEPNSPHTASSDATSSQDSYGGDLKKIIQPITMDQDFDQGKLITLVLAKRHRDPTTAMIHSMLVPGWGQFYNNQPIKGFLAIVAEGTSAALTIYNYNIMHNYDRKSRRAYDSGDFKMGDFYNDRFRYFTIETEKNFWFFVGSAFLFTLDAYIDAELSDFDIYDLPRDPNAPADMLIPLFSFSFSW